MRLLIFGLLTSLPLVAASSTQAIRATGTQVGPDSWVPLGVTVAVLVFAVGMAWKLGCIWTKLIERVDRLERKAGQGK